MQTVQRTVEILQVPLLDRFLTCPFFATSGAQSACQGRRHLCRGADAVSPGPSVQTTTEILQLQSTDKVFDVCCAGPASSRVHSVRRQSSSHSCSPLCMDTVVAMPVVVQRQMPGGSESENCEGPAVAVHLKMVDVLVCRTSFWVRPFLDKVVDMPVVCNDGGLANSEGASDSVHRQSLCTFLLCNRDGYAAFSSGGYGGDEGFFSAFLGHFSSSSRSSGVERQFSEPSMAKSSLPSRAPLPIEQRLVDMGFSTSSARVRNNNNNNTTQEDKHTKEVSVVVLLLRGLCVCCCLHFVFLLLFVCLVVVVLFLLILGLCALLFLLFFFGVCVVLFFFLCVVSRGFMLIQNPQKTFE